MIEETNNTEKRNTNLKTAICFVAFIISLGFNFWAYKDNQDYKASISTLTIVKKANEILIDSINKKLAVSNQALIAIQLRSKKDKENEQQIKNRYDKVYKTIASTPDTSQLNLLESLLAKSKQLPVTRD